MSNPRDTGWFCNKLGEGWVAANLCRWLNCEILNGVIDRFTKLSPSARLRLLFTCLYFTQDQRIAYKNELDRLLYLASADDEEWVRVIGILVSGYQGQLSLQYFDEDKAIAYSLTELEKSLEKDYKDDSLARPLEEDLLAISVLTSRNVVVKDTPMQLHFGVKPSAKVLGPSNIGEDHDVGHKLRSRSSSGIEEIYKRRGFSLGDSNMFRSSKLNFKKQVSVTSKSGGVAGIGNERKMKVLDIEEITAIQQKNQASDAKRVKHASYEEGEEEEEEEEDGYETDAFIELPPTLQHGFQNVSGALPYQKGRIDSFEMKSVDLYVHQQKGYNSWINQEQLNQTNMVGNLDAQITMSNQGELVEESIRLQQDNVTPCQEPLRSQQELGLQGQLRQNNDPNKEDSKF